MAAQLAFVHGIITHFEASGQQALKALGYDPGPVDGIFGGQTESAVRAFQQAGEIAADGVVGRVTWINIDEADQSYPALKEGATGLPVRRLQSRMSAVGFDAGVAYDVGAVRVRYPPAKPGALRLGAPQRGPLTTREYRLASGHLITLSESLHHW